MIINNTSDNNPVIGKDMPFTKESLFQIQDEIEVLSVEYSPEDIENETFLNLVASKWPEDYHEDEDVKDYSYYLEYKNRVGVILNLKIRENGGNRVINSVSVDYGE